MLSKRWWLLAVAVALSVSTASLYVTHTPRIYEARASIIIDSATPQVLGGQFRDVVDVEVGSWWSSREYIQTQYNVIRSRMLAEQVAWRLDKGGHLPKMGLPEGPAGREAATDQIMHLVGVEPVKDSRIVNIVVRYTDPDLVAILANEVAEVYIEQNLTKRLSSSHENSGWLDAQLTRVKKDLEDSEEALYDFKRKNNTLSVSLEDSKNMLSQQIQRLGEAVATARTKRIELSARRKVLSELKSGDLLNDPIPDIKNNDTIAKLKELYADQAGKLIEMKGKYLDQHPAVLAQQARLDAIKKEIQHEAELTQKSMETEYNLAVETERALLAALEQAKAEALDVNKKQIDYDKLRRAAENNSKVYDLLLGRLKESDLAGQLKNNNVRPLDKAQRPTAPVGPNVPGIMVLALALGVGVGMAMILLLDIVDNTVKSQDDIENRLGVSFLGLIPRIPDQNPDSAALHIIDHPKSSVAECCRAIRTNLLFMSPDHPLRSVLVTSSGPMEGKSTTSINLAVTMAQNGNRVLLVDTDLRRPRLHRAFGVSAERGMSSLIVGEAQLDDCIKSTQVSNLWVIPCGPLPPNPAELLHTHRFHEIVAALRERYDLIVFDSPPLGVVTDAAVLSTAVDGTIVVAKGGRTTRDMMARALRQLSDVKAHVLGSVLNDIDLNKREYAYNLYYYQRYGKYYEAEKTK